MKASTTLNPRQERFLTAYASAGTVCAAAELAKINRQSHYRWLGSDQHYRVRFQAAREELCSVLEDETVRRAVHGWQVPIYYKGKQVGERTRYSDTLLIKLLEANIPEKYCRRRQVAAVNRPEAAQNPVPESREVRIERLKERLKQLGLLKEPPVE